MKFLKETLLITDLTTTKLNMQAQLLFPIILSLT